MRRTIALCLTIALLTGCNEEKKPNPEAAPQPAVQPAPAPNQQPPADKNQNSPTFN